MSQSQSSTNSYSSSQARTEAEDEEPVWPLRTNSHLIERFSPEVHVRGSGDNETAFRCIHCGEEVYIPEDRAVPDHEWATNRFSLQPCPHNSSSSSNQSQA